MEDQHCSKCGGSFVLPTDALLRGMAANMVCIKCFYSLDDSSKIVNLHSALRDLVNHVDPYGEAQTPVFKRARALLQMYKQMEVK